ncbi:hypothetical protein SAMN05421690_101157 [Nitrosomonas sp. Nm51]|uniref:N-acyl amino acid synthase FeeM domain-containing protein n=1 Tax=Nitrosomonas sp. Nm51 TaxID=133720 RepID=UPI0008D3780F|nr:long-chain N-acyl amino acid synthase [Nitrosomonas sp. Nm51]SER18727.1 hypothetical protein SAMN05421690_101157 [Nitrosomonas sp. Nm51]
MFNIDKSHLGSISSGNSAFYSSAKDEIIDDVPEDDTYVLQKNEGYDIHFVQNQQQCSKAKEFVKQMYALRGYQTQNISIDLASSRQITFVVVIGEMIVGAVTLRNDSSNGLLADALYQNELDGFREKDRNICELSKFALDPQYSSKEMIASLFQIAYVHARKVYQATDFFCEVNPRHAAPHKRMFGFRQIGEERTCARVDAPAVLLHLELGYIQSQTSVDCDLHINTKKSIYSYFSSNKIEEIIFDRLPREFVVCA